MKKLLSTVLAILMVASVFLMTGCMKEEDYYTKTDVDGFVTNLQNEIASKNDAALAEISGLKAIYEAKIALLDKEDGDLKAELKNLTDAYNAKVAELEAADKATADALAAHKTAYETELAKLQTADTENKAAIEALTIAYNAKVAELEAADKANADALAAHKTAYETELAKLQTADTENKAAIEALTTAYNAKVKELEAADKATADALAAHKAAYETELAKLQKADTDNKTAIDALTTAYDAKVKELEAADKATADALAAHKTAYETELAKLQKADTDNKAAIDALTTAYNAKVAELNNKITENTNALNAHKTAYEAKVAEINGKISANETAISNLETELEAKINQVKADTEREIGEINTLITQLQNADTTNANAIKALTDAYNAKVAELAEKDKAHEDAINELEDTIDDLKEYYDSELEYLKSNLDFYPMPDGTYAVSVGKSFMMDIIEIPAVYNGKAVTSIAPNGFANCENLTSVIIPDSVTSIGEGAFFSSAKLKTVYVSKNITEIKDNTFSGCSSLETVNIPAKVTAIGAGAFAECASLKTINIPMAVTAIGEGAFIGCNAIERIDITDLDKFNAISFGNMYANPAWNIGKVYLNGTAVEVDATPAFDGAQVNILIRSPEQYMREWYTDEPATTLDSAVFQRNNAVEENLDVKLNLIKNTNYDEEMNALIAADGKSGAGEYHIVSNYAAFAMSTSVLPYYKNLRDNDMKYLELDEDYWNQNFIESAESYGKLYGIVGDVTLSIYDRSFCVFFNRAEVNERLGDIDLLYELVLDGEWTYDLFYEMIADMHEDNGTTDTGDDFYGVASIKGSECFDGFLHALGGKLTEDNGTGKRVFVTDDNYTKLSNIFNKVSEFWAADGAFTVNGSIANYDFFTGGQALFDIDVVYHYASGLEKLYGMEDGYGILPMPKYDADQLEYTTGVQDAHNVMSVMKNSKFDYAMISAVLEEFSKLSADTVLPVYKTYILGTDNSTEIEVFDMIFDGMRWDFADIYSQATGNIRGRIWRNPLQFSTSFNVAYAQYETAINESLDDMDEFLSQVD